MSRTLTNFIERPLCPMTEKVFAVRAHMADSSVVELLLFADRPAADNYVRCVSPLPLGFDRLEIVERQILGVIRRQIAA